MKRFYLVFLLLITYQFSFSQDLSKPGEYMTFIGQYQREITKDFMSYTSAVAHGKSARKIDNRRKDLITSVKTAQQKTKALKPFEKDASLRDSVLIYLNLINYSLQEDYEKIINMEEVAEQSYDAMEAYLLAQDLVDKKVDLAGDRLAETQKIFAKNHNVTLIDGNDKLSDKVVKASQVSEYYRKVYLIFFKSYKQEMYMLDALKNKNVSGVEQNKSSLLTLSQEGVAKARAIPAFKGDKSLQDACIQMLNFYIKECNQDISNLSGFFVKEENYNKIKKAFEEKKQSDRTKQDVDQFNAAVNERNAGLNQFNATNTALYNSRSKLLDNWNKSTSNFLDKHTPKYR